MTSDPDVLTLAGVGKTFRDRAGTVEALSGVDLVIRRGEFVTLFGPSGCGKSTLLRILAGLEAPTEGTVSLFGQAPQEASRDKNIAWIPQSPALLPWLSIRDNAAISGRVNRAADRRPHPERIPGDAAAILAEMGLGDRLGSRPAQLSGGMRQRAALARGFVQGSPLLLMDEPFSALDDITREGLRMRLLDVWEEHRKTVVFVTHSAEEAALLSDRVVVMAPGPGRIHEIVDVDLPRPRSSETVETPEFADTVRRITDGLRSGWSGE